MDVQAIPFTASSPQPAHWLKWEDWSHPHQPEEEKTKCISPKEHVLHRLQGVLLRLYSQPARQWYALQHCTLQTLMNWSSQTLCKAGNHYLPFTDGELRHSKTWMICLEEICSRVKNWTQTFQISEHHPQSIQFQSDLLGNLSGIVPLVTSRCFCCSSLPQRRDWILHRCSNFIHSKFCFHGVCITNIMNYNSFLKKIRLQSEFFLNWLAVSQQTITWYC